MFLPQISYVVPDCVRIRMSSSHTLANAQKNHRSEKKSQSNPKSAPNQFRSGFYINWAKFKPVRITLGQLAYIQHIKIQKLVLGKIPNLHKP